MREDFKARMAEKYGQRAAVRMLKLVLPRALPGVNTVLLVKDAYEFGQFVLSEPAVKAKLAELEGLWLRKKADSAGETKAEQRSKVSAEASSASGGVWLPNPDPDDDSDGAGERIATSHKIGNRRKRFGLRFNLIAEIYNMWLV